MQEEDSNTLSEGLKDKLEQFNEAAKEAAHEGPSYEELKAAYEAEKAKAQENWEKLLRKEADLQNVQRRATQDVDKARNFAIERFVTELLVVADSFDQGLSNPAQSMSDELKAFFDGMVLTQTCFMSTLEKFEVTKVCPQPGEAFNPSFHEALTMQETADFEPNKIIMVIQNGYALKGRLIRPARVVISRAVAQ